MGRFAYKNMGPWPRYAAAGALASAALFLGTWSFRGAQIQILSIQPEGASNRFRLTWSSTPGNTYQLQGATALPVNNATGWVPVLNLQATGTVSVASDVAGNLARQRFYRIAELNGSTSTNPPTPTISPVAASPGTAGGSSSCLLQVVIGGTQTVSSVTFFDNGNLIGAGQPDLGSAWSIALPSGPNPQIRRISVTVTTLDGGIGSTPTNAFLQADAARYVPLNPDGSRNYGQFVSVDPSGNLGPFLFFPEGPGDGGKVSGAHFQFPAGASLQVVGGANQIQFNSGTFFRGNKDSSPLSASAGLHTIGTASVTPAAVLSALGRLGNTPIQLLWGSVPVPWLNGALSGAGWSSLSLRPPIGDFILPGTQDCVQVTIDPKSGEPTLMVCYHGDWAPFPGGPQFRIPAAEPLKVFLSLSGKIAAYGTVEATFSSGATVRGSVAWREPNFEVRFQGRSIVIPALSSFQRALPTSAAPCIPTNTTTAALDASANCLTSLRDAYRSLAMGGAAEASTSNAPPSPALSNPTDSAGTALNAWASRLSSWNSDRAGQTLDSDMLSDLGQVAQNAGKTAEAAQDLPTVLKLARDLRVAANSFPAAAGPGASSDMVAATIADALARAGSASRRIIADSASFKGGQDFGDIAALYAGISQTNSPAKVVSAKFRTTIQDVQGGDDVITGCEEVVAKSTELFDQYSIGSGPSPNPLLQQLDPVAQFGYLEDLTAYLDLLRACENTTDVNDAPAQFPIKEAFIELQPVIVATHNSVAAAAIAQADYLTLVSVIRDRAKLLTAYRAAGLPIDQSTLNPAHTVLLDAFESAVVAWLVKLDPNARPARYTESLDAVRLLNEASQSPALAKYVQKRWLDASNFNKRFFASIVGAGCEALADSLADAGFTLPALAQDFETSNQLPLSGKYESVPAPGQTLATLQLNQAGRYIVGSLEYHRSFRYLLRGLFLSETATAIHFAVLRIDSGGPTDGTISGSGELVITNVNGALQAQLTEHAAVPGLATQTRVYLYNQVSSFPAMSPAVIALFSGEEKDILQAEQTVPLHTQEARALQTLFTQAQTHVIAFADAAGDHNGQLVAAADLNVDIGSIINQVDPASLPVVRLQFLQSLVSAPLHSSAGTTRSLRDLFMNAVLTFPGTVTSAQTLLGTSVIATGGNTNFVYDVTLEQTGANIDVGLGVGASGLNVTVKKMLTDGTLLATFQYKGYLGQASVGPQIKVGVAGSVTEVTVTNAFDYQIEDLEGFVVASILGVNAIGGTGVALASSAFAMYGRGILPPLILDTGGFTPPGQLFGVGGGGGWEVDAGRITAVQDIDSPEDLTIAKTIKQFTASTSIEFLGRLDFELGSAALNDCGRQYLREFVAEHRAMFANPDVEVAVFGFTDTLASDAFNQQLSQQRADTVRAAIIRILGSNPNPAAGGIASIGLGENPARLGVGEDLTQPPPAWLSTVNAEWQSTVRKVGQLKSSIPDNTPDPEWRRAVIVLNGLISVKLRAPD